MALEIKLEDFKDLDPQNVGNWPIPVKIVIIILLCGAVAGALYYFLTQPQLDIWNNVALEELKLRDDFKKKQWEAATLPKLKEQLVEIESNLSELQRQLPSKTEVASLIQDISQQAIANALKSELFQPGKEKSEQIYVEYPIKLQLNGQYHEFGKFVSGVAGMPRIVTQHDISIRPLSRGRATLESIGDIKLLLDMTAKIYRYREEEPEAEKGKPGAKPATPPKK